jgi:hypothetical protein
MSHWLRQVGQMVPALILRRERGLLKLDHQPSGSGSTATSAKHSSSPRPCAPTSPPDGGHDLQRGPAPLQRGR